VSDQDAVLKHLAYPFVSSYRPQLALEGTKLQLFCMLASLPGFGFVHTLFFLSFFQGAFSQGMIHLCKQMEKKKVVILCMQLVTKIPTIMLS